MTQNKALKSFKHNNTRLNIYVITLLYNFILKLGT